MTTRGQFTKKMLSDICLREVRQGVFEYTGPVQNNRPKNKSAHRNPEETR